MHLKSSPRMAGMNGQVEVRVRSVPSTSGRIQRFTGQVKNTNAVLLFTAADFDRTIQVGEYITLQIIKPVKDGLAVSLRIMLLPNSTRQTSHEHTSKNGCFQKWLLPKMAVRKIQPAVKIKRVQKWLLPKMAASKNGCFQKWLSENFNPR